MSRAQLTSVATILLVLIGMSARAQEARPERPYRGLFGGGDAESQQGLTVSGSIGGGYDSDLASEARRAALVNIPRDQLSHGGPLGQFSGTMSYSLTRSAVSFSANAGTAGRYYPSGFDRRVLRRENAGAQGTVELGAGLNVSGSVRYSPFRISDLYQFAPALRVGQSSDDFDFGSSAEHYLAYSGDIDGSWSVSRRGSVSADYRYAGRAASTDVPDHRSHQVGGAYRYNLARGLDLKLGYRYTEARYGASGAYSRHGINAGVDFQRALSFSRRTTLGFSSGTTAFDDPTSGGGLRYRATGSASLGHEIGRTWSLAVSYERDVRLSETWPEPIFADMAIIGLNGLVNRRFAVHSSAGSSMGHSSVNTDASFRTYFASAGLSFAIGRHAAFATSYRYHYHRFAETFRIAPGVGPEWNRHSVQANFSVWAPIFSQRARTR